MDSKPESESTSKASTPAQAELDSDKAGKSRSRLPFEPSRSKRKKAENKPAIASNSSKSSASKSSASKSKASKSKASNNQPGQSDGKPAAKTGSTVGKTTDRSRQKRDQKRRRKASREEAGIPEAVSRRMIKRMAFFSGMPTFLGVITFFGSYVAITQGLVEVPGIFVLLSTMLCFGLGVLGLSYGALSSSWDEDTPGSLLGGAEFQINFGRMTSAWRDSRSAKSSTSDD
ncbi:MAG: PAM68 family protein [Cyanobacteria bacterium P01_D01_bin.128]